MPKPTRTTNPIHFTDLEPLRFEDLCRSLIYPLRFWHDFRHYGRSGSDGGVDIWAVESLVHRGEKDSPYECRVYKRCTCESQA